jgi:exodeoxyribonuclease-5
MLHKFFLEQVKKSFPYTPTDDQEGAMLSLNDFFSDPDPRSLFLLTGYAGTGKSSLAGALVKAMRSLKQPTILLAPTGRAAKVFSAYAERKAFTIHKKIYRRKAFSDNLMGFVRTHNPHKNTLFIVDEASMISNASHDAPFFGDGRLLDDLIQFVYSNIGCRLILLGDAAQLPPVTQSISPALDANLLEQYDLTIHHFSLKQVVRQTRHSGILLNATHLRRTIEKIHRLPLPKIRLQERADVLAISEDELPDTLQACYDRDGVDETVLITRSNKRAGRYNAGIRNTILWRDDLLSPGDLLMVVKNNYFHGDQSPGMSFIANGDLLEVKRIRHSEDLYGFSFCNIVAWFPDYRTEMEVKIIPEMLASDTPSLSPERSKLLSENVLNHYSDLSSEKERMIQLQRDPHLNALHVKYAYALTCHKAQGGQWKNVFIDLNFLSEYELESYRWLYTAFTRATERIYLLHPSHALR